MLATIGWSRRGASEVKLYSPSNQDNNNDKNNNNGIGYAETSSSSSNGEKNSKIQSNEINCVEWSKSNGNCVAIGLSDGRVVVLDKQLQCVGEVKEEERKRERFKKRENDDHAEKEKVHKNTPLTFAAENPARDVEYREGLGFEDETSGEQTRIIRRIIRRRSSLGEYCY